MKIFLYDEFTPEDTAMMQALYSRSAASVEEHAQKVRQTGSGKFMERFYVGYGHASIADCGSTTIFIEDISILADKAIQDWPLYSGQETSTRYVDMSKQRLEDPLNSAESATIQRRWMQFYLNSLPKVEAYFKKKYPIRDTEKESIYNKAIQARAFDSLRAFLPAGITTQLSWHTNLRQAWDKISILRHHPLVEVQNVAEKIHTLLKNKYPHSFSHPLLEEQENYRKIINNGYNYYHPAYAPADFSYTTTINAQELAPYQDLIKNRPAKTGLPNFLSELGQITFNFLLDYGSFRDIQRHRNGICRMPLLTTDFGFHAWYLEQLPSDLRTEAINLIAEQKKAITGLNASLEIKQYYIAMGFLTACRATYGLPATLYITELRSGKAVHPTLRKIAHKMHASIMEIYPDMKMFTDLEADEWDVRRGEQDITQKTSNDN